MSIEHLLGKVHNCDCLEFMKQLPDKCVDLVLTDPPYGIGAGGINFKNGTSKNDSGYVENDWDKQRPNKEIFEQIQRISKNQIIWGGNYFADMLPASRCWIFWDKGTGDNSYADGELAYTSFDGVVKKFYLSWVGANAKDTNTRHHPTQKPEALMRWCLNERSQDEATIFDPFMGSGTTAVACERLGRRWFGCELEPKYVEIANKRIEEERAQLKLF